MPSLSNKKFLPSNRGHLEKSYVSARNVDEIKGDGAKSWFKNIFNLVFETISANCFTKIIAYNYTGTIVQVRVPGQTIAY